MPLVTLIGGPNGSGKTTLYKRLVDEGIDFGTFLNADEFTRELRGDPKDRNERAQQKVRSERDRLLASGADYGWETVMSHPSHVDHLLEARSRGYEVQVLYVALEDPKLNVGRVEMRVLDGGHDVPRERIKRRYFRSINNLADALFAAHQARIFDNSSARHPFAQIARVDDEKLTLEVDWFSLPRWFIPALVSIQAR